MKLKTTYIAILLAVWATHTFAAEPETLSYKGARLGATKAEFQEKLPDYQCQEKYCAYRKDACNGSLTGVSKEAVDAYTARSDACKDRASFGGALVTDGFATFRDGAFVNLILTIPTPHMEILLGAVEQRYGQATETSNAPFVNRAGAEFPNWKKTWKIGEDYLTLTLRSGRIDEGEARLVSAAMVRAMAEQKAKQSQQGSKDF